MQTYSAPLRDMRFVLNELLDVGELATLPGYEDATPDVIDAMIEEGAKLCENTLLPLNRSADEEGCHYENGVVRTPAGYKEAYKTFVDAGWTGVTLSPDYGGKGLPQLISMVFDEMVCSTNLAFGVYPLLSNGAAALIETMPRRRSRKTYLPRLADGTWSGTMCLTEPHCGTDLGLIRTKAVPTGEAATPSPAPRSSFPPASMTSPRTSSIWCWRGSPTRRPACAASASSWCRSARSPPTAARGLPTVSPAAPSRRRWAFTGRRPA